MEFGHDHTDIGRGGTEPISESPSYKSEPSEEDRGALSAAETGSVQSQDTVDKENDHMRKSTSDSSRIEDSGEYNAKGDDPNETTPRENESQPLAKLPEDPAVSPTDQKDGSPQDERTILPKGEVHDGLKQPGAAEIADSPEAPTDERGYIAESKPQLDDEQSSVPEMKDKERYAYLDDFDPDAKDSQDVKVDFSETYDERAPLDTHGELELDAPGSKESDEPNSQPSGNEINSPDDQRRNLDEPNVQETSEANGDPEGDDADLPDEGRGKLDESEHRSYPETGDNSDALEHSNPAAQEIDEPQDQPEADKFNPPDDGRGEMDESESSSASQTGHISDAPKQIDPAIQEADELQEPPEPDDGQKDSDERDGADKLEQDDPATQEADKAEIPLAPIEKDPIKYTPSENSSRGHWEGNRGDSKFIPSDPAMKDRIAGYGQDGVSYRKGEVDFSPFAKHDVLGNKNTDCTVDIPHMAEHRNNLPGEYGRAAKTDKYNPTATQLGNFEQADMELGNKLGVSPKEIEGYRKGNGLSWHECGDGKTMQLVPTDINKYFDHFGGVGTMKDVHRLSDYYDGLEGPSLDRTVSNPEYKGADGKEDWPPDNGFEPGHARTTLPEGTLLKRYGDEAGGRFFTTPETPVEQISLPYDNRQEMPYRMYEVTKPLDVEAGEATPHFDQPGGGDQFMTEHDVKALVANGYLRRIEDYDDL